jgi:hypothetical protein
MKRILAMFLLAFSLSAFAGEDKAPAPAGEKPATAEKSDKSKKHGKKAKKEGAEGQKAPDAEKKP